MCSHKATARHVLPTGMLHPGHVMHEISLEGPSPVMPVDIVRLASDRSALQLEYPASMMSRAACLAMLQEGQLVHQGVCQQRAQLPQLLCALLCHVVPAQPFA